MRASTRGTTGRVAERTGRQLIKFVGYDVRKRSGAAIDVGRVFVARRASGRTKRDGAWRGYKAERHIVGKGR